MRFPQTCRHKQFTYTNYIIKVKALGLSYLKSMILMCFMDLSRQLQSSYVKQTQEQIKNKYKNIKSSNSA